MRPSTPFELRIYRAAHYFYPPSFRREFSAEMVRDFHEARHEPHVIVSSHHVWAFRRQMAADLVSSIVIQWMRSAWPAIVLLSLAGPLAASAAAATVGRFALFSLPGGTANDDILVLLLVVVTVLAVISATIIFTYSFAQPLLRRRV